MPGLADNSFIWLQAVVDGRVLPDTPERLLGQPRASAVPLIIGTNARELPLHGDLAAAPAIVRDAFGNNAPAALDYYGLGTGQIPRSDARLGDVTTQLATDLTFRCPTAVTARSVAGSGGKVWRYVYDYTAPDGAAVTHGSELRSVFESAATGLEPGAPPLQAYWVQFVKTGDPNGRTLPLWPRSTADRPSSLTFGNAGPVVGQTLPTPCRWRIAP